ncbi:MAG TPA: DegV family protein, partial [Chromatiales bacterium]|nr:DegV family protein [Chromatiales bacterium]
GESMDRRRLREELSTLGNSMVLAGTHRKLKIHIHTNEPERVFECAARYGQVSATKADDMQQQARTVSQAGANAVIVTDSGADLPDQAYEELGIHVVPLRINFGDRSYMDKLSLSPADFFRELKRNPVYPQTSQPAPGDFRRVYEFLASHFSDVISISMTRTVSGTWQAAVSAAERVRGGNPVRVVDSRSLSAGQGLIVMHAAECARAGLRGERLLQAVERSIDKTCCYGLVSDLSWAVRGGRIPGWLQKLVERLGLAPIFRIDSSGELKTRGVTRSRGDLAGALARYVMRRIAPGQRYRIAVAHADWPDAGQRLADLLGTVIDTTGPIPVVETSAVLGTHGGPGTLVVGIQQVDGSLLADTDTAVEQPQGQSKQADQKHQNDRIGHPDVDV